MNPANYPPVTAAGFGLLVTAGLNAFTDWTAAQTSWAGAAAFFAAAAISTAFTRSRRSLRKDAE